MPGTGAIVVNGREVDEYFPRPALQILVRKPMELTDSLQRYDVIASVHGGGIAGQVTGPGGEPLSGVSVWARNDQTGRWISVLSEVTTDGSGSYTMGSLSPGPWTLAMGGTSHALTLFDGLLVTRGHTTNLDARLEPGVEIWVDCGPHDPRSLAARVVGPNGDELPLELASISRLLGELPPEGRLRVGRVQPGTYHLTVLVGGEPLLSDPITLLPEQQRRTIVLE